MPKDLLQCSGLCRPLSGTTSLSTAPADKAVCGSLPVRWGHPKVGGERDQAKWMQMFQPISFAPQRKTEEVGKLVLPLLCFSHPVQLWITMKIWCQKMEKSGIAFFWRVTDIFLQWPSVNYWKLCFKVIFALNINLSYQFLQEHGTVAELVALKLTVLIRGMLY